MRQDKLSGFNGSALAIGLLCASAGAHAQVEEIIVTAQKIETSLQETPIAISAIAGDDLARRQVTDVEGLMKTMPNVDFGISLGTARIAMRGVGFDNLQGGNEGRIAFHEDGVYYSRPVSILSGFYDIERVEALRGPQGTLYGRNATGGVVNLITRDPGEDLNGYLALTAGNYELLRGHGALGGPLTDALSARVAFQVEDRGGYGTNETTGSPVDDRNTRAARIKLRYEPTDSFDFTLVGDHMKQSDHANGYVFFQHFPISSPAVVGAVEPQPLAGELFGGVAPRRARNTAGDVNTRNEKEFGGVAGTARLHKDGLEFTSITAWRWSHSKVFSDMDQTSAPVAFIRQDEHSEQFSEELRVNGEYSRGNWLVGAYYFSEDLHTGNRVAENPSVPPYFRTYNPDVACPSTVPQAVPNVPRRPCTAADLAPYYAQGFTPWGLLDTSAYAIFGNVQYDFTDEWSLRAGLRYSDETKEIDEFNMVDLSRELPFLDTSPFPAPPPATPVNSYVTQKDDKSYSALTPSVTLSYQPTDDAYLYATYSEGFKSGGYNVGSVQPAFDAESIVDYEVGAKLDWLGQRLRTNFAAFYYDYSDIQANKIEGTAVIIFNAPGAQVKGAEFEIVAAPTDALRMEASGAWLDTEYDAPFSSIDPARPWLGPIDLAGNQLTQAAKYSANLAAQYTWTLPMGDLSLRGETQYKDRVYFSVFNLPFVSQPSHWISNAFVNFESASRAWSANLYVRNIEDKLVRVAQNVSPAFWGTPTYGAFAPPRTYGLEIGYRFD